MMRNSARDRLVWDAFSRRRLLGVTAGVVGPLFLPVIRNPIFAGLAEEIAQITPFKPCGPGAACVPRVMAAGYYGPRCDLPPDDEKQRELDPNYVRYLGQLREAAKALNLKLDIAPAPLNTPEDARRWAAQVEKEQPDGLVVIRLSILRGPLSEVQSILLGLDAPMLFFVPNQKMFGWGSGGLREELTRPGRLLCATQDFGYVVSRLNHLAARARLREMRFVNVTGNAREESRLPFWGSRVLRVPLSLWHEQFIQEKVKINAEVKAIADYYLRTAQRIAGPSPEAVLDGRLCCLAARNILEQEQADAFTMDCKRRRRGSGNAAQRFAVPCFLADDGRRRAGDLRTGLDLRRVHGVIATAVRPPGIHAQHRLGHVVCRWRLLRRRALHGANPAPRHKRGTGAVRVAVSPRAEGPHGDGRLDERAASHLHQGSPGQTGHEHCDGQRGGDAQSLIS